MTPEPTYQQQIADILASLPEDMSQEQFEATEARLRQIELSLYHTPEWKNSPLASSARRNLYRHYIDCANARYARFMKQEMADLDEREHREDVTLVIVTLALLIAAAVAVCLQL